MTKKQIVEAQDLVQRLAKFNSIQRKIITVIAEEVWYREQKPNHRL